MSLVSFLALGLAKLPLVRHGLLGWAPPEYDDYRLSLASLAAFSLLHSALRHGWRFAWALLLLVHLMVVAAEAAALRDGFLFGRYRFAEGSCLGPGLLPGGVPLLVPLAWYCSSYCSLAVAEALLPPTAGGGAAKDRGARARAAAREAALALLAAALTAATDLAADPIMSDAAAGGHHQWRAYSRAEARRAASAAGLRASWAWLDAAPDASFEGVPLSNFAGWFLTSLAYFAAARLAAPAAEAGGGAGFHSLAVAAQACTAAFYVLHAAHAPAVRLVSCFAMLLPALLALARLCLYPAAPAARAKAA